jgi:hypothetical protein
MKSIPIAEGDPSVAKLFTSVFQQSGWCVASSIDADCAVKALRAKEHFEIS